MGLFGGKKDDSAADDVAEDKKDENEGEQSSAGEEGDEDNAGDEEEEVDDDDFEDEDSGDEEDGSRYSPEAQQWSENHFDGKPKYAKYYSYAMDRTALDIKELRRRRTWRIKAGVVVENITATIANILSNPSIPSITPVVPNTICNIEYSNHADMSDFFMQINFGWDFKCIRKWVRQKGGAPQTGKGKKGKKPSPKYEWVRRGQKGITRLTNVRKNVDKGRKVEYHDCFEFTWHGSYFDLWTKNLRIEVWDWNQFMPNVFLASEMTPLKHIACGAMRFEWQLKTERRKRGKLERVPVGTLGFQCVFQEVLHYTLQLKNWTASINPWLFLDKPEELDESENLMPLAIFDLDSAGSTIGLGPVFGRILGRRSRSRVLKMIKFNAATKYVTTDLREVGDMRFKGTRLELEDGTLRVQLYDFNMFVNKYLGIARIPLKSVVEVGHLSSRISWQRKRRNTFDLMQRAVMTKLAATFPEATRSRKVKLKSSGITENVGSVSGLMEVSCRKNRLWREFRQVGELQPPELRDFPPYNYSYLAVKIVAATDLVGVDESGLSDPFFTVEWAGQRMRTKTIYENLNPVFNETLFFHIRGFSSSGEIKQEALIAHPFVTIACWDFDETGSRDLLGTCRLYLHEITGCGRDYAGSVAVTSVGRSVQATQPRRLQIRRRRRRGGKLKPMSIMTRQYRGVLKLQGLPRGVDSRVRVEAYFRGPEGDLKEHDKSISLANGSELLLLPNLHVMDEEASKTCLCFPRDAMDRDVYPPRRLMCESARRSNECRQLFTFKDRMRRRFPKEWARVNTILEAMDCENFMATNQYGSLHFLPTYLSSMTPPAEMIDEHEKEYLIIRSSQKPNSSYEVAQLVRTIRFENFDASDNDGVITIDEKTWLSPDFFLTMRKGDVKAHVLLLANCFLGLNTDAYVCIGEGRAPPDREDILRTKAECRSRGLSPKETQREISALQGKERPYVWLMTRESTSACCGEAYADFQEGGAVKFWEAAHGAYFPPLPNRCEWKDDEQALLEARGMPTRPPKLKRKKPPKPKKKEEDSAIIGTLTGPDTLEPLTEDDMLDNEIDSMDVQVAISQVFELGAGIGDDWGKPSQVDQMQESERVRQQVAKKDRQRKKNEAESKEQDKIKMKWANHERRLKWIARRRKSEAPLRQCLPYTKIVAVFNHCNLWVNVQENSDPAAIGYDMDQGEKAGWLPVLSDEMQSEGAVLSAHYAARNLGPAVTPEKISDLEHQIVDELESGIHMFRYGHNVGTRFASPEVSGMINKILEAKHALERLDKIKSNGWSASEQRWAPIRDPIKRGAVTDSDHPDGFSLQMKYHSLLRALEASCPPGFKFRLGFAKINNADAKEVRKAVLGSGWGANSDDVASAALHGTEPKRKIHEMSHGGREMFAVGCLVVPFNNNISLVRVGVLCVYPASDFTPLDDSTKGDCNSTKDSAVDLQVTDCEQTSTLPSTA